MHLRGIHEPTAAKFTSEELATFRMLRDSARMGDWDPFYGGITGTIEPSSIMKSLKGMRGECRA
jgi:hypothetical protein